MVCLTILVAATLLPQSTQALNRGHQLFGVVTGLEGEPIADVVITILDPRLRVEHGKATTDEDGAYRIVDLPQGSWDMIVRKSGYGQIIRRLELMSLVMHEYKEDVQFLTHRGLDAERDLALPEGVSVKPRALKLRRKAGQAREAGDYEEARSLLEKAIQRDPTFARAHTELGLEYQRMNDLPRAEEFLRRGMELNPADPIPKANLGALLLGRKQPAEAVPLLEEALLLDARLPRTYLNLGQAYISLGRLPEAIEPLRKAGEFDPRGCGSAYGLLGNVYLKMDSYREARDAFLRFVELHPGSPQAEKLQPTIQKLEEEIRRRDRETRDALGQRTRLGAGTQE